MECCRVRHLSLLVYRLGEAGSRGGWVVHGWSMQASSSLVRLCLVASGPAANQPG